MITGRVAVPAVVLCALLLIQCRAAPTSSSGLKQQPMKPMNAVEMIAPKRRSEQTGGVIGQNGLIELPLFQSRNLLKKFMLLFFGFAPRIPLNGVSSNNYYD
uniref:Secreted protein n=1 Tax=Panagrellus redivivus TaxID=6233 RepID=A0A7E4VGQ1_PANRE